MIKTVSIMTMSFLLISCGSSESGKSADASTDASVAMDTGPGVHDAQVYYFPDFGPIPDAEPLPEGVTTVAGTEEAGNIDGFRSAVRFSNPANVIGAPNGDLFVADYDNNQIRRVSPTGLVVSLPRSHPKFMNPFGMAIAQDGRLFIQTDRDSSGQRNGAIWVTKWKGEISQIALVADQTGVLRGMTMLADGRLIAVDYQEHVIYTMDTSDGSFTVLAGAVGQNGYVDGKGTDARFDTPYDVIQTKDGSLIVADQGNHRLRQISLAGEVTTFAGTGQVGSDDGEVASATFNYPQGLAVTEAGVIYVADNGSNRIRKITTDKQVLTIAGDGTAGFRDDPDPLQAQFFGMEGIALGNTGKYLYVADGNHGEDHPYNRLRRLSLESN